MAPGIAPNAATVVKPVKSLLALLTVLLLVPAASPTPIHDRVDDVEQTILGVVQTAWTAMDGPLRDCAFNPEICPYVDDAIAIIDCAANVDEIGNWLECLEQLGNYFCVSFRIVDVPNEIVIPDIPLDGTLDITMVGAGFAFFAGSSRDGSIVYGHDAKRVGLGQFSMRLDGKEFPCG